VRGRIAFPSGFIAGDFQALADQRQAPCFGFLFPSAPPAGVSLVGSVQGVGTSPTASGLVARTGTPHRLATAWSGGKKALGQMMFPKYFVVVDDDVDMHNTSEVLFRLCANTDPQRDSIFTKGPSDVLDHATSEIASGSKLGIDATKKIPGEGFKRPWPPLIKMDEATRNKIDSLFKTHP